MGALLRQKVERNERDELWRMVGEKMDKGEMIPDVRISQTFSV